MDRFPTCLRQTWRMAGEPLRRRFSGRLAYAGPNLGQRFMVEDQHEAERKMRVGQWKLEHEDLKAAIEAMQRIGGDPLRIQRLKKKILELKDRIESASSDIIPDIIA